MKKNIEGETFGRWTVLNRIEDYISPKNKVIKEVWKCKCACGNIRAVLRENLIKGCTKSCGCSRYEDLTGKTFGHWRVLYKDNSKKSAAYWMCECKCGVKLSKRASDLRKGRQQCHKCNISVRGPNSRNWKGYMEISGYYFSSIKHSAEERNLEFSVTIEYIWDLFLKQDRKCAYTGQTLTFAETLRTKSSQTASLDRIDSSKGYIKDNLQWVHKDINYMKTDISSKDFIENCNKVCKHSGSYPRYTPTWAELLDRLSIVQLKEVLIPEHKAEYAEEIQQIMHDLNEIIAESEPKLTADLIRAIMIIAQYNLHIWHNESNFRKGIKDGNNLELTHGLNSIRNFAKNKVQSYIGGRKDYKLDSVKAFKEWIPSTYEKGYEEEHK